MSIIDDFADIAKRMKGESWPKPKVEEPALDEPMGLPVANWRIYGIDPGESVSAPPIQAPKPILCTVCQGSGLDPTGRLCYCCKGKGLAT